MYHFRHQPANPEQLLEAFHILDPEGHGYLTREVISTLMTQDGEPFNQDELDEMLEIAIDPHTQSVPYEYYINQLMVRTCNILFCCYYTVLMCAIQKFVKLLIYT